MSGAGLACLVVDDERPALEDLERLLRGMPEVGRVDTTTSPRDALLKVGEGGYDVLFLDVRMPGLDGVALAKVLGHFAERPAVVFVSAYEDAAVQAFELHAVDYLMKPVSRTRLAETLTRLGPASDDGDDDVVPVDLLRGGGTRLLPRASILYLQAHGDYVRIYADEGRFLLRATLGDLERRWEPHGFARVHRGYVANLRRATELRPQLNGTAMLRFPDGHEIPISRRQVGELRRRLRL